MPLALGSVGRFTVPSHIDALTKKILCSGRLIIWCDGGGHLDLSLARSVAKARQRGTS